MSNPCQGCSRQLNDSFLCSDCQTELREILTELALGCRLHIGDTPTDKRGPSFLRYLMDSRVGHTRLGESERRSNENSRPALARLTSNEADSFRGSPLELCNEIHDRLTFWAEAVSGRCETLTQEKQP
jgi:hypothetical protein